MKNKIRFILFVFSMILIVPSIFAVCTVTFDKATYAPGETILAEMFCTENGERNIPYSLPWINATDSFVFQNDTGTTPGTTSQRFYKSYLIPITKVNITINASLRGTGLEGFDSATVTGAAVNTLIITNLSVGGKYLGLVSSMTAVVHDENGKKITGGLCNLQLYDNTKTTVLMKLESTMINGEVSFNGVATYIEFKEGTEYSPEIHCMCGGNSTLYYCIDEDGLSVTNSIGTASSSFTMNQWVTFYDNMNISYSNGTLSLQNATFLAGYGNKVYWYANKTNYFDSELIDKSENYLISNITGLTFISSENSFSIEANSTLSRLLAMELPASVPSGIYFIRQFHNIYYQNILVAQYVLRTNTFTVVGTEDSFKFNGVVLDKTNYYTGEYINICANITSTYDTRVEFEISYRYRCGNATDVTGLSSVDSYTEIRGINPAATQLRCAHLKIPYADVLTYSKSSCQAIVTLKSDYINTFDHKISLQGINFNVTDFGMYLEYEKDPDYPIVRLYPDWRRFDKLVDNKPLNYFRAKINITDINEVSLDPLNHVGDSDWDLYAIYTEKMPCSTDILNYTVLMGNGSKVNNPIESKALQWKDKDGNIISKCGLGIEEVNFSDVDDDYFEVYVWYEDFEERSTEALEEIANKTGTFHFSIECPDQGVISSSLNCTIKAQVESDQVMQKEVDFTCYIPSNGLEYSSFNFNQMVNKTMVAIQHNFYVPNEFINTKQYIVKCEANYYNLGSRTDTFYDAFYAVSPSMGLASASSSYFTEIDNKINNTLTIKSIISSGGGIRTLGLGTRLIIFVCIISLFILGYYYKKRDVHNG